MCSSEAGIPRDSRSLRENMHFRLCNIRCAQINKKGYHTENIWNLIWIVESLWFLSDHRSFRDQQGKSCSRLSCKCIHGDPSPELATSQTHGQLVETGRRDHRQNLDWRFGPWFLRPIPTNCPWVCDVASSEAERIHLLPRVQREMGSLGRAWNTARIQAVTSRFLQSLIVSMRVKTRTSENYETLAKHSRDHRVNTHEKFEFLRPGISEHSWLCP